jgi:hypothetical protein
MIIFYIGVILIGLLGIIDVISHIFGKTIIFGILIQKIKNPKVRTLMRVIQALICLAMIAGGIAGLVTGK